MTSDSDNPYMPPTSDPGLGSSPMPGSADPATMKKIEAVLKDAGQFWLAIVLCCICTGWGMLIIGPWYLVRLIQWSTLGREQPWLMDRNAPPGSLPRRFQAAKIKLIIGLVFGAVMVGVMIIVVVSGVLG